MCAHASVDTVHRLQRGMLSCIRRTGNINLHTCGHPSPAFPSLHSGFRGLESWPTISSKSHHSDGRQMLTSQTERTRLRDEIRQMYRQAGRQGDGYLCKLLLQDETDYIPFWVWLDCVSRQTSRNELPGRAGHLSKGQTKLPWKPVDGAKCGGGAVRAGCC